MKRHLIIYIALLVTLTASAQRTCVVANMEDHVPIRDAIIHTSTNHWARTDYRGYWAMRYSFDSATVSKPGFIPTTIYFDNLPDTVFLLPEAKQLHEVEVWGKDQEHIKAIEDAAKQQAVENGAPSGILAGDYLGWLDRRNVRDRKHRRQAQGIISDLSKESDDPIMDAYLKQKKEEEEKRLSAAPILKK